jgi:hypothetical protein
VSRTSGRLSFILFAALASAAIGGPRLAGPACADDGSAIWTLLSGPVDPQPSWTARAIHDPIRHRLVIVNGLNPGVMWVLSLPASAPPVWQRFPISGPTPPPRWNASVVLDSLRDRAILFGGSTYDQHSLNDLWALSLGDAPQWSQILPEGEPPSIRESHVAILDPVRDRMVVFGGYSQDSSTVLGDTWMLGLGGTPAWAALAPTGTVPGPRDADAAVFDPWGDRMMLFGSDNTTWSLSLAGEPAWDSIPVTTPRPTARLAHSATLDPLRRRMIVHGGSLASAWGTKLSDTWAFQLDGPLGWVQLATSGVSFSVMQQAEVYSPERGSLVEFGGNTRDQANACHELDLGTLVWSGVLPAAPDSYPLRRAGSFLTVDEATGRLLVYGGGFGDCLGDLWAFDRAGSSGWTLLSTNGAVPDCSSIWSGFELWNFVRDTRRDRLLALHGDAWWGRAMNRIFALPLGGGGAWTELFHQGVEPLGRYYPSLVYDPVRDRVLMFGGVIYGTRSNDSGSALDDLWALSLGDTLRWTQLHPSGSPGTRDSHSAAYDARRDRMVVFGGETQTAVSLGDTRRPLHDTWALPLASDGLAWSRLSDAAPFQAPAVLDSLHDRLVAWPGDSTLWVLPLEGSETWRELAAAGDLPTPRSRFGLGFDTPHDRLLVFGGMLAEPGTAWSQVASADLYELSFTDEVRTVLVSEQSAWDRITLTWTGLGSGEALSVLRARDGSGWIPVASLTADDTGRLAFTDLDVEPGQRYGYSVAYPGSQQRYGEVWVTVPPAPAFALRGLQPNPAGSHVSVAFTLPDAEPARLQFVDVSGRRVVDRRLAGLGPGPHVVSVEEARGLPAGLYFVRLTHGGRTLTNRAVIVR